mgnify:CR=1 FL=1
MSKLLAIYATLDANSLEAGTSDEFQVKTTGAIERTASGINVASGGITDAMLAGSIIF